jgi:hypothetical protein
MTLEGEERVIAIHPAAVVDYADERNSPASDQDLDLARTGVDAVFDEFFHHGSRTLHHFAGRNLAGDDVWQQANAAHLIVDFRFWIADCEQL